MKLLVNVIAGVWLFAVGVEALGFMTRFGLLPLPEWVGRLDFTPQYPLLVVLLLAGAALARWGGQEKAAKPAPEPRRNR